MHLKWNVTGVIFFAILAAVIYAWGPGWQNVWCVAASVLLYLVAFGVCFVVVRRH